MILKQYLWNLQKRREPDNSEPEIVAPRSQEPQEKLYLVTILLLYLEKEFSIEYVTKSISQFNAKEDVKKRFFKVDFSFL